MSLFDCWWKVRWNTIVEGKKRDNNENKFLRNWNDSGFLLQEDHVKCHEAIQAYSTKENISTMISRRKTWANEENVRKLRAICSLISLSNYDYVFKEPLISRNEFVQDLPRFCLFLFCKCKTKLKRENETTVSYCLWISPEKQSRQLQNKDELSKMPK